MMNFNKKPVLILIVIIPVILLGATIFLLFENENKSTPISSYSSDSTNVVDSLNDNEVGISQNDIVFSHDEKISIAEEIVVTHIATPEVVKALYISSWVAGSSKYREPILKIIDETEINSLVIDIKDSTGKISFKIKDALIEELESAENRIRDIKQLTTLLHEKGIYIIGRISVFQDSYVANKKPEWAIKRISDGKVWKDKKGLSFLDPSSKEVIDYTITIAKASYELGFDEINFDYIRYPTDGNMKDINYQLNEGKTRADKMERFFVYLNSEMKKEKNIPLSADLFGLTTEAQDDMGIGQIWEKTIPHFDFICPMIYPSHYPKGYLGFSNPAEQPYKVIYNALKQAIIKTEAIGEDINKIRPWLQDFDLGASYTKDMIRAQIEATNDNGISSWMLWDPKNKYTPAGLLKG
jgi:hypothetical protein